MYLIFRVRFAEIPRKIPKKRAAISLSPKKQTRFCSSATTATKAHRFPTF
jgi:hypothetical protein